MSNYRWDELANYNAEVRRGIVHTPEHRERMARDQAAFDAEQRARRVSEGYKEIGPGLWQGPARRLPWWRRLLSSS